MLQPEKSDFVLSIIKEVEAHKDRIHWKLMIENEVNNTHRNKGGKPKTILSIWSFNLKRLSYGRLNNHRSILCVHGEMKQWVGNY